MDNNNQTTQATETSLPPVKNFDPKIFAAAVFIIILVVGIVVTILSKTNPSPLAPDQQVTSSTPEETVAPAYLERVNAGEALPAGFPKTVLTEPTVKLDQSYTLTYEEGEQATVVFVSDQGIDASYASYLAELKKDAWIIVSAKETDKVSAIYAMKDTREINITIVPNQEGKAEVSISTFNR